MSKTKDFICFNCGTKNNHFSRVCPFDQKFTRCPVKICGAVAKGPNSHKLECPNLNFVSKKIGEYDLPLAEFQIIRFVFKNTSKIYSVESSNHFLITKFLSIGTNIRFRRVYTETNDLILDMKIKPTVTLGIGRTNSNINMASLMFTMDQVRINHYQNVSSNGTVMYNLSSYPKKDEKHDIELKLSNKHPVVFFSINWNNTWKANIAMSNAATTVGPFNIPEEKKTEKL